MIVNNLSNVRHTISKATNNRKVSMGPVKLIAVTKNHPVSRIQESIACGISAIGENRVQEALEKFPQIEHRVEWHLIGHLQTNKAKSAVTIFDIIHSVDSEKLALEINHCAEKINKVQDILLQVNIAGEDTKFGMLPEELLIVAQAVAKLPNLRLGGMMTIAPHYENVETTRPIFKAAYQLFCQLQELKLPNTNIKWLSMGMTNDYRIAVEEGANLVRVGTGIFGERQY